MFIVMNGRKLDIPEGKTLAAVLQDNRVLEQTDGVAVAINAAVVPRRRWADVHLHEGDAIEVIHAVQGG